MNGRCGQGRDKTEDKGRQGRGRDGNKVRVAGNAQRTEDRGETTVGSMIPFVALSSGQCTVMGVVDKWLATNK